MAAVTDVLNSNAPYLNRDTGEALRLISEGTSRLSGLVNDLMEISRFDAGAAELSLDESTWRSVCSAPSPLGGGNAMLRPTCPYRVCSARAWTRAVSTW
ncbi:hypothetical protein GCM10023335_55460 [Streptomyces siamensis]|uniref:Signal transduction histidine kinase dimerisation/phosphoacceptor domain-containing protein n=1 Tax=Streptomyces siamensis TaxID=1274986 RepID=A0ABP9J7F2_9ACTN